MKTFAVAAFSTMLMLFASIAPSAEIPFDQGQFDAARAAGKPVSVVFHADWCPTCRAQAPVLKELTQQPAATTLTVGVFQRESGG